MLHIITGGAGFIAFNLARKLIERGDDVFLIDDLSRGRLEYVKALKAPERVRFAKANVAEQSELDALFGTVAGDDVEVWHLCANSDIPAGVADPAVDLKDTFLVTYALLRAMRVKGWTKLHFASTSAVYGDHGLTPINEATTTEPISNYGAMKLASEAAIRAACEAYLERASIFRFPNVVGVPATHGVILDFIHKLQRDPTVLPVLGDGTQCKAYLHVAELVEAMLFIRDNDPTGWGVYNIGPSDSGVTVRTIAETVRDRISPEARLAFGSENRGWVGDVPRFSYQVDKLTKLGWTARYSSANAIARAVDEIVVQEGAGALARA